MQVAPSQASFDVIRGLYSSYTSLYDEMSDQSKLEGVHSEIRDCTLCSLYKNRERAVPGEGPEGAELFFVGEAPGAREDETGRPFVGKSGQLLTELIEGIGLQRSDVFITSVLKCRPPRNRTPQKSEIDTCLPYLDRQIEAVNPQFVILLGGVAISSIIGPQRVSEAHGRFYEDGSRTYFMTYHPAAALRFPKTADAMREDFQILKKELFGA